MVKRVDDDDGKIGMERVFEEPVSFFVRFKCVYFWTSLPGKIFWLKGGGRAKYFSARGRKGREREREPETSYMCL